MVVALLLGGTVFAESVEWIDGIGQVAPPVWSINPTGPSSTDTISFRGPLDHSYGNSCSATSEFGGTPYLSINSFSKTIELKFQGPPPETCILIYKPAVGLKGEFGPLAPGNWIFKCTHPKISFLIDFVVSGGPLSVGTIYVDQGLPPTIWFPNGSSWSRAYPTLQDALAVAQPGHAIHVAKGTYVPDQGPGVLLGDRLASFVIPEGVKVLGSFGGWDAPNPDARDLDAHPTVLSGDLNGDDLWGILNISENSYHVVSATGSGRVDGVVITAGNADGTGNEGHGGGVLLESSTLVLRNCKIDGNKADFGAGVACVTGVAPTLVNTEITGNWATMLGGALYNDDANVEMTNCLVTGNTCGMADILGSDAIFNGMGSLVITNCTIADNRPGHGLPPNGRAIMNLVWGPGFVDTISIKNSILRNGGNEVWSSEPGIVTLHRNNIEGGTGGYAGSGNINQDPLFKNPGLFGIEGQWFFDDDGYTLLPGSPSIDAGNQALLPPGIVTDLNGNARVLGGQVDQGAYEGFGLPPAVVLVPYVVGQSQAVAQSTLASAGLVLGTVTQAYSPTVSVGRVISQTPLAGSTANVGSAVGVTISKGPAPGASWQLVTAIDITMTIPSNPPSFAISTSGPAASDVESNFAAEYKIEVTGVPAVGGNWTATPATGTIPAGTSTISFTVNSTNVHINSLPAGSQKVAEVKIFVRPQ